MSHASLRLNTIGQSQSRGPACVESVRNTVPIASPSPGRECDPDHTAGVKELGTNPVTQIFLVARVCELGLPC